MREIIFRGKRVDNGEWVYGYYVVDKQWKKDELQRYYVFTGYIDATGFYEKRYVHPESVGQYTGLKDKKGKDIYEGDKSHQGTIEYWNGTFQVIQENGQCFDNLCWCYSEIEVIGNIHNKQEV